MKEHPDKLMTDLHRLLETQDFKSEEELRKFMDNLIGKQIPSFPQETLTNKEQAQNLVFDAYDLTQAKAKANIEKALKLDPDCIEAYEFLGTMERTAELASTFYEKGISIGRKKFGSKYLEKNKGFFWGLYETRPFMRCLQHYSDCLYVMGKVKDSVAILEEMIELNPNDNQGARDQLLLYLIQLDEDNKFLKYSEMFPDDNRAFSLFNQALFLFKTEGESEKSNKLLTKAKKQNKFVARRLLSDKPMTELTDQYSLGSESEADYYVYFAGHVWSMKTGAIDWLKKSTYKVKK